MCSDGYGLECALEVKIPLSDSTMAPASLYRYLALKLTESSWSAVALFPISGDQEVVAAAVDLNGTVSGFNVDGILIWRKNLGGAITASPLACDLDADGMYEIGIGSHNGWFYALCGENGELVWKTYLGGRIRSTAAAADVDGDTRIELFVAVYGNWLYCLDGSSGQVRWRSYLPKAELRRQGGVVSSPLLADINADGRTEVVVGTRSKRVYALDSQTGKLIWFRALKYDIDSSPSFAAIEGLPMVFVGGGEHTNGKGDNSLHALRGSDGASIWCTRLGGGIDSSPIVADLNQDARPELVVTTLADASCYALDGATGRILWRHQFGPTSRCHHDADNVCYSLSASSYFTERAICRSYTTPLVADMDGNGKLEVVVGSNNGQIVALDGATGELVWSDDTGGMVRGSVVMMDVDHDGYDEMFVPSDSRVLVYRTQSRGVIWPMFKGEPMHIGEIGRPDTPAPITAALPRPHWVTLSLLWHWLVKDTLWFILSRIEARLFAPLGIKLFDYVF